MITVIMSKEAFEMARKKKCCECKEYFDSTSMIKAPNGSMFCNFDHLVKYAHKNKEKGAKIKRIAQKKEYQANDLSIRKKSAVKACHAFIRERDKGKKCITCDNVLTGKFDAGHYLKSTHSYTKFMAKNIHGQCVACNQYNGGREVEYRKALIEMYGLRTVEALERVRFRKVKRSASDYLLLERYFKEKLLAFNFSSERAS